MNSLSILLVDDSGTMAELLGWHLAELGHKVVATVTTGSEAIAAYKALKPDLVTMDISMPDMDGIQATKAIVGEFPEARIIMVTSHDEDQMILKALRAGAKGYVIKPFEAENVREVIEKACRRKA